MDQVKDIFSEDQMNRQQEEKHLSYCVDVIKHNIETYEEQLEINKAETKELYDNYRSNNPELHSDLVMGLDWQKQLERALRKNLNAVNKPYFGRIDYIEHGEELEFSLYIGKNGIAKDVSDILIVDWRAPVSSVYYDSDVGEASYPSPEGDMIKVALNLKRTYEIDRGTLLDYYDTDVISNDEFLTKYLAKNKEVVLGEIIATIQKEQNEIIRDTPWHSVIVQGVAGSGKTTVAMHRISYLLYNFKDKLRQDEFYIIGSNKTLLNYIVGVLPNLDVYHTHQLTMTELFLQILDDDFPLKKLKFQINDVLREENKSGFKQLKGSILLASELDRYLAVYEKQFIKVNDVVFKGDVIYLKDDICKLIDSFPMYPAQEKIDVLNKRLINKIKQICEKQEEKREIIRAELNIYKDHFGKANQKIDLMEVYRHFLLAKAFEWQDKLEGSAVREILYRLDNKIIDLYDLSLLTLIKKRLRRSSDFDAVSHIVVDEAQDFGVSVFAVLKKLFVNCNYTIMGDVSQNIYYDTGMNDWRTLREEVFQVTKDKFYVLAKSYRNTVEISNYASEVLKKCTFETYEICPIVRHGKPVEVVATKTRQEGIKYCSDSIKAWLNESYDTTAVICHDMDEARQVQKLLSTSVNTVELPDDIEEVKFVNGIMVLPVHLTKGLEFDTVILWNPSKENYPADDANAKLLYVAITRALHECKVVYQGELTNHLK